MLRVVNEVCDEDKMKVSVAACREMSSRVFLYVKIKDTRGRSTVRFHLQKEERMKRVDLKT